MTSNSSGADVARRLLLREALERGSPDALADAGERIFARLDTQMRRWLGGDGYAALIHRTVNRTRVSHPAVLVRSTDGSDSSESTVMAALRSVSGPDAEDLAVHLLGTFLSLLGRLVGDEMAMRLMMQSWPDAGKRGPQTNP